MNERHPVKMVTVIGVSRIGLVVYLKAAVPLKVINGFYKYDILDTTHTPVDFEFQTEYSCV